MKTRQTSPKIKRVLLVLVSCCLFAGCSQDSQKRGPAGFPVRLGVQGDKPIPVKLNSDANSSIFIEFAPSNVTLPVKLQPGPNDRLPVALVLDNGQVLPIRIKSDANAPFPVVLQVQQDKPLPVILNLKEPLPVSLNIKGPLPVEINVPPKLLILAAVPVSVIIIVCIVICLSCRRKQD
jgi:hypothetical protein